MGRFEDVTASLAEVKPEVRERVSSAILAALSLAEAFRSYGSDFTFDVSETLSAEVMKLMRELSDNCLEMAERRARTILSWLDIDDADELIADAEGHDNEHGALWAFDMHASNLLRIISAWAAIGFGQGMKTAEIFSSVLTALSSPGASEVWRNAVREGVVDPNELKFGRGYQRRITDALTVLIQSIVFTAYTEGCLEEAEDAGALYYVVHRGSTFDCPLCDGRCERPTPVGEPYYPSHPRCMCWLEFLYSEEEARSYRTA